MADALGVPDDGSGDGSRAVQGIRNLLGELEFPALRSIGATERHLDSLTELALEDPFHRQSPEPWTAEEMRGAFAAALAQPERGPVPSAARRGRLMTHDLDAVIVSAGFSGLYMLHRLRELALVETPRYESATEVVAEP